jgi:hypothetical protein
MWACDSRRFGAFATRRYSAVKTEEAYERTYLLPKPEEELPAARPLKTSPIHDLLAARGAVFGAVYGWERPNWFAPEGVGAVDECSFHRPNYFEHVGKECRQVREGVVLADILACSQEAFILDIDLVSGVQRALRRCAGTTSSTQRGWRPKAPGPAGGAYRGSPIQDLGGACPIHESPPGAHCAPCIDRSQHATFARLTTSPGSQDGQFPRVVRQIFEPALCHHDRIADAPTQVARDGHTAVDREGHAGP